MESDPGSSLVASPALLINSPTRRRIRLLLVNPRFPESFWSFRWAVERVLPGKRAVNPPLGLATLAALCPPHWDVEIVDENVETIPLHPDADIIGICGMGAQFARQSELLAYYRGRGHFVVAGGSYASLCPEKYAGLADCVVAGEAERIWPQFCADLEAGQVQHLYREQGRSPSIGETPRRCSSPAPSPSRWWWWASSSSSPCNTSPATTG